MKWCEVFSCMDILSISLDVILTPIYLWTVTRNTNLSGGVYAYTGVTDTMSFSRCLEKHFYLKNVLINLIYCRKHHKPSSWRFLTIGWQSAFLSPSFLVMLPMISDFFSVFHTQYVTNETVERFVSFQPWHLPQKLFCRKYISNPQTQECFQEKYIVWCYFVCIVIWRQAWWFYYWFTVQWWANYINKSFKKKHMHQKQILYIKIHNISYCTVLHKH